MRVTIRSARNGRVSHNDRSFLFGKTPEWIQENAPHINISRTPGNIYWTWDGTNTEFEKAERKFYTEEFGPGQECANERYRKNGHCERCKTVDDIYKDKQRKPEEVILQIGDREDNINPEDFSSCVADYVKAMQGGPEKIGYLKILTVAIHLDEEVPHAHLTRCWINKDKWGYSREGLNGALKLGCFELPDPKKPEGRFNNRKMTFDKYSRQIWIGICQKHGFDVDTDPLINPRVHKKKVDYIYGKLYELVDEKEKLQNELSSLRKILSELDGVKENPRYATAISKIEESISRIENIFVEQQAALWQKD